MKILLVKCMKRLSTLQGDVHGVRSIGNVENSFEILKRLGEGANGVVYKVRRVSDGKEFALKEMDFERRSNPSKFIQYIKESVDIMKTLSSGPPLPGECHVQIVCYHDLFIAKRGNESFLYVLMQLVSGQTIEDLVREQRGVPIPAEQMLSFMRETMLAVDYIHSHSIAHLDLKSTNVIFDKESLVIIDFDFACSVSSNSTLRKCKDAAGTPIFVSPEMYLYKKGYIDSLPQEAFLSSDIWSLGIMFLEMAVGTFVDELPILTFKKMIGKKRRDSLQEYLDLITPPRIQRYTGVDPLVSDIIYSMLTIDFRTRPSSKEVLNMLAT